MLWGANPHRSLSLNCEAITMMTQDELDVFVNELLEGEAE